MSTTAGSPRVPSQYELEVRRRFATVHELFTVLEELCAQGKGGYTLARDSDSWLFRRDIRPTVDDADRSVQLE